MYSVETRCSLENNAYIYGLQVNIENAKEHFYKFGKQLHKGQMMSGAKALNAQTGTRL